MGMTVAYTGDIAHVTLRASGKYWWLDITEGSRTMFVIRMPNEALGRAAQKALQEAFNALPGAKSISDIMKDLEDEHSHDVQPATYIAETIRLDGR